MYRIPDPVARRHGLVFDQTNPIIIDGKWVTELGRKEAILEMPLAGTIGSTVSRRVG